VVSDQKLSKRIRGDIKREPYAPPHQVDSAPPTHNTRIIVLLKATKGRRMSKKSHKKSSSPANVRKAAANTAKAKAAKAPKAVAKPSRPKVVASQHAPTKPLKSSATAPARVAKEKAKVNEKSKETTMSSPAATSVIIAEGGKAPNFSLPRDGGGSVSLQDFRGKKLVLFFYPKADTPGCTREAIAFTALSDEFSQSGTTVVGISADTVKAQEKFRDKHGLSVPLMSDETHEILEAYGVWGEKSMYGRKFMGIVRTTVLVGPDGRIARLWRNVKVDGHADEVLTAARDL
jgi:thioredoxin-dependent peroxiredoxin